MLTTLLLAGLMDADEVAPAPAPNGGPVSMTEAKRQLRQPGEQLDDERTAEIEGFMTRAVAWVERYTGHILTARYVTEEFAGFERLRLRAWPVKPGAVPILTYEDRNGDTFSVTAVRIRAACRPARVELWAGSRWPSVCNARVTITVRAGYESADVIPGDLKSAILILINAYDADREGGDLFTKAETTARLLCSDYRMRSI